MVSSAYKITLDLHAMSSPVVLNVKRGDTGRKIHITLVEGGRPYHISEDCYAAFTGKKPDENIVYNECKIEDDVIIYELTPQTVAAAGLMECEVKLYGDGYKLITSASFDIVVNDTVYNEGDEVESTGEFTALTQMTVDAKQATDNANAAANKAIMASKSCMVIGKAEGESIFLDDATDQYLMGCRIFGKTTQDGTPAPDAPVDMVSIGDSGSITLNVAGEDESQSVTLALDDDLRGVPAASDGDYTDANGKRWACDELDLDRGVRVTRVKQTVLTADEYTWHLGAASQQTENTTLFYCTVSSKMAGTDNFLCDRFPVKFVIGAVNDFVGICGHIQYKAVYARLEGVYTLEEFLAWIAENPITIVYEAVTPVETAIAEEELAAYSEIYAYRESTTISNDASAPMVVEYVMDAKKYIDSLVAATSASRIANVDLLASAWVGDEHPYSQVISLDGITENSQVDLTPGVEQLAVFYEKDLAFVTENDNGVVTVYAIGQKPENDYTIQATITEVNYG